MSGAERGSVGGEVGAAGGGGRGQHLRGQDPGAAAQPRHADIQGEQQSHSTALVIMYMYTLLAGAARAPRGDGREVRAGGPQPPVQPRHQGAAGAGGRHLHLRGLQQR